MQSVREVQVARLRRLGRDRPLLALVAVALVWSATMGVLVWRRHDRYTTYAFDLGIHDQAIWLMARGRSFVTVRGMPALGHHATFAYWALAPLSWLGAGPQVWDALQAISLGLGVVPLHVLARRRLPRHPWAAAALASTWLLQPSLQFLVWETFHPEAMALTPLLCGYVAATRRAWWWSAGFLLVALSWKEDVALVVLMLGVLHLLHGRWRAGVLTGLAGAAWLVFTVGLVVPHQNDGRTFYGEFYGSLGHTPSEVLRTGLRDPEAIRRRLAANDAGSYAVALLRPTAFVALAAPEVVLLGLPQAMVNLLSTQSFTHDDRYHYVAMPLLAVSLGVVEGVGRLARLLERRRRDHLVGPLAGAVLTVGIVASLLWGTLPGSREAHLYWPRGGDPTVAVLDDLLAQVPRDAGLAAGQRVVPHVSGRDVVYTFPNPWRPGPAAPYGVDDRERGDAGAVDWLVVDRAMPKGEVALLDQVLAAGTFEVLHDDLGIVVARRIAPPRPGRPS